MIAVGVPLISPVEVSKDNPAGRDGDTDHEVTVPPLDVGVKDVIVAFLVKLTEVTPYDTDVGGASLTIMLIVVEVLPPVFVAVTV